MIRRFVKGFAFGFIAFFLAGALAAHAASSIQTGKLELQVQTTLQGTVGQNVTGDVVTFPISFFYNKSISNGTGASQATSVYKDNRTLAASASETLDINGGTVKDAFGNSFAPSRVIGFCIAASGSNTNNVVVGNAAANAWAPMFDAATDTITYRPGGAGCMFAPDATGWTADGTHKNIKIANSSSGTAVTYDILIIGN
jgi:hypothetical protein